MCCNPQGHKEVDTTQKLNNSNTRHRRGGGREGYLYLLTLKYFKYILHSNTYYYMLL